MTCPSHIERGTPNLDLNNIETVASSPSLKNIEQFCLAEPTLPTGAPVRVDVCHPHERLLDNESRLLPPPDVESNCGHHDHGC